MVLERVVQFVPNLLFRLGGPGLVAVPIQQDRQGQTLAQTEPIDQLTSTTVQRIVTTLPSDRIREPRGEHVGAGSGLGAGLVLVQIADARAIAGGRHERISSRLRGSRLRYGAGGSAEVLIEIDENRLGQLGYGIAVVPSAGLAIVADSRRAVGLQLLPVASDPDLQPGQLWHLDDALAVLRQPRIVAEEAVRTTTGLPPEGIDVATQQFAERRHPLGAIDFDVDRSRLGTKPDTHPSSRMGGIDRTQ